MSDLLDRARACMVDALFTAGYVDFNPADGTGRLYDKVLDLADKAMDADLNEYWRWEPGTITAFGVREFTERLNADTPDRWN